MMDGITLKSASRTLPTSTSPASHSPLYDWAHEEYRKGMESAVCDLTHALLRMSELEAA